MRTVLLLLTFCISVFGAQIQRGVSFDPNTLVVAQTNLTQTFNVVNATDSVNTGVAGQAGLITVASVTSSNNASITMTSSNLFLIVNGDDALDNAGFSFQITNALTSADIAHFINGTNLTARLGTIGGLTLGQGAELDGWNFNNLQLIIDGNEAVSGSGAAQLWLDGHDSDSYVTDGWFNVNVDGSGGGASGTMALGAALNGDQIYWDWGVNGATKQLEFRAIDPDAGIILDFRPTTSDGNAPYLLSSSVPHTSGDFITVYNSTNVIFTVAANSGWTNSGTLFLSDDGTYKPVSSGTTINSTDLFLPYRVNGTAFGDSPLWVGTNTWYSQFGTNVGLWFFANGAIFDQRGFDFWGTTNGVNYVSYRDTALGDYNGFQLYMGVKDSGTSEYGQVDINGNKSTAYVTAQTSAGGVAKLVGSNGSVLVTEPGGPSAYLYGGSLSLSSDGSSIGYKVLLSPLISPGAAPAFYFNSLSNWAGTNILKVQNLSTDVFVLRGDSGYSGAGTLVLTDDGTYKSVSGVSGITASSTNSLSNKDLTDGSNTLPGQIGVACSDETTALTTGTAKVTFRMPYAMTVTAVRASLSTGQTSGNIFTVDINEGGNTILSTKITIDNGEKTSTTAATAPVISDSALADDAEITVDIDQVGDGTAKGLKIWLIGTY